MKETEAVKLVEASEERADTILRTAMDGFWLFDKQGRLLEVNDTYCRMIGYAREELLRMSIRELEANESSDETAPNIIEIKQAGSARFERQHKRKDGRIIELELSITYLPNSDGRFFCFLRDITERKHNEAIMAARLRLSQYAMSHSLTELLRATLDEAEALTGSHVGFYHFVEPDQVTLSLQAWSTNTTQNMCKAEGAGLHYPVNQAGVWVDCIRERRPVIHNDYASLPHRKGLPEGHSPVVRELVVPVMRGDSIVAVLGVGNKPENYDDRDSKTVATLADLAWDITERKRAEDALRLDSEIMANMPDGVFLIRLSDGMIVHANDQFERMFGYDHGELIGQHVSVVNALSDKTPGEKAKEIIEELSRNGAWAGEVHNIKKDGTTFWCSARVTTFKNDRYGTVWIAVHRDITERKMTEEALRIINERFDLAARAAHIGVWDWDVVGNKLVWDDRMYDLYGVKRESFNGAYAALVKGLHSDDVARCEEETQQALRGEKDYDTEFRIVWPDGTIRHLKAMAMVVRDAAGNPVRVIGINTDITERKRAEEALRNNQQNLESLFNAIGESVSLFEPNGNILAVNETFAKRLGKRITDCVGNIIYNLIPPDVAASRQAIVAKVLHTGLPEVFEDERYGRWLSHSIYPVLNTDGSVVRLVVYAMDITQRRRSEEALRESEERIRNFFDLGLIGMALTSLEKGWLLINNRLCEILGYSREELSQKTWAELTYPDDLPLDEAQFKKVLRGEMDGYSMEKRFIRADGGVINTDLSVCCVRRADRSIRHFVAMIQDVSERKMLQAQFQQAQKMESIGQLAGGVAHDFNNIMAATMMQLSFLQRNRSLDQEALEMVKELMAEAKRAASLTAQLLIFSRRSVLEIKVLDLNEVVANLLKMLSRLIGEHISLRFDRGEALPAVEADARMIEQVVMNLAVNARDAMPKGGLLTIRLESIQIDAQRARGKIGVEPGTFVCVTVADTGCGMDKATLKSIFEPFFTTKEVGKGTGLGLATVDGIVAQHKGWVDVESELGKGTTFKVFLPATTQVMAEPATTEKIAVIRGHETILLVEDEMSLRRLVAQGLRMLGYRVLEADNGQTAMKLWQEHGQQIDLLFSDMVMPEGFTGLDLAEKLRQVKTNLKVIISSGYNVDLAGHSSQTIGGIVYFQKPYEFEVLSKTIRDCLDRP